MLQIDIDQYTICFLSSANVPIWQQEAESIIDEVMQKLDLGVATGPRVSVDKGINGYDKQYKFEKFPSSINTFFAYHTQHRKMGVLWCLSAKALRFICGEKQLSPVELLQSLQSERYKLRLSRCDVAADFINEGLSVNSIYDDVYSKQVIPYATRRSHGKNTLLKLNPNLNTYSNEDEVKTLVLGKYGGDAFMRIYDKKFEQIKTHGVDYLRAIDYDDWVRFELQLGGKYAHAITTELLSCTDERDVLNVLTGSITSRFSFYEEKGGEKVLTPYSAHLQANTGGFTLKANTELQDFSLADSVNNQLYNSGLFALLYKVDSVFGAGSSEKLMKFLLKRYQTNYTPNRKHKQWVKEYKPLYTKQFKTYINWEYDQLYKLK